jgi:catechol 2,3-dioxygenase-like lactoylglutathione lyase family enzyme
MPIDHVTLEVSAEQLDDCIAFWELLDFARVPLPEEFANGVAWMYHGGTAIHLVVADEPDIPRQGHAAVVLESYASTTDGLREAGFELRPQTEFWGSPRAYVTDPAGHTVEVMEAPPPIAAALGLEEAPAE